MRDKQPCENPEEPCQRLGVRKWAGKWVCTLCYKRFWRNGSGSKLRPWDKYKARHGDKSTDNRGDAERDGERSGEAQAGVRPVPVVDAEEHGTD